VNARAILEGFVVAGLVLLGGGLTIEFGLGPESIPECRAAGAYGIGALTCSGFHANLVVWGSAALSGELWYRYGARS
jgi:hypothetical protein